LKGSGNAAFGGAIAFFPTEVFGLELRFEDAGGTVEASEAAFRVRATLPAGLPPVDETLKLENGTATMDDLQPFSLNLKLRTTGSTKLFVSGGVSRISGLNLRVRQQVALGVTVVDFVTGKLTIETTDVLATQALAAETDAWGGNLGLGFELPLGEHAALVFEGRGFYFSKQQLEWEPTTTYPAGSVQAQLLTRVLESLPPVDFEPWWAQASVGLALRF
jgi:hypothetical protein